MVLAFVYNAVSGMTCQPLGAWLLNGALSQPAVETVSPSTAELNVGQLATETVSPSTAELNVGQPAVETVSPSTAELNVGQPAVETVSPSTAEVRISQSAVETVSPSTEVSAKSVSELSDVVLSDPSSPFKGKRGVPVWYKGKVSPAFERHIFWPSPPRKKKTDVGKKQLFPACASSSVWRQLYSEKKKKELNTSKSVNVNTAEVSVVPGSADENQTKKSRKRSQTAEVKPTSKQAKKTNSGRKRQTRASKRKAHGLVANVDDDHTPCHFCGKQYNTADDDKARDEWLRCSVCGIWAHESCAEKNGVIGDDDDFICKTCIQ